MGQYFLEDFITKITLSGDYLMHFFITLIAVILLTIPGFTMEEHIDLSFPLKTSESNLNIEIKEESPSPVFKNSPSELQIDDSNNVFLDNSYSSTRQNTIPLRIETIEDVENAGYCIGCLEATRGFWTVSTGIFDFLGGIGNPTKSALVAMSNLGDYSPDVRRWMGVTTILVSASTLTCNMLAQFGYGRATNAQRELKEIEGKIKKILKKYDNSSPQSPTLLKIKNSSKKISTLDQKKIDILEKRYSELTDLSGCEKSYFSFSNCFLRNIHSTAGVMEVLLNIGNFVMVPLSTIPSWDPTTTTVLSILTVCIEGGSIFAAQMKRQSESTNRSIIELEKDLEEYQV